MGDSLLEGLFYFIGVIVCGVALVFLFAYAVEEDQSHSHTYQWEVVEIEGHTVIVSEYGIECLDCCE